jgi:hypothetical protein
MALAAVELVILVSIVIGATAGRIRTLGTAVSTGGAGILWQSLIFIGVAIAIPLAGYAGNESRRLLWTPPAAAVAGIYLLRMYDYRDTSDGLFVIPVFGGSILVLAVSLWTTLSTVGRPRE